MPAYNCLVLAQISAGQVCQTSDSKFFRDWSPTHEMGGFAWVFHFSVLYLCTCILFHRECFVNSFTYDTWNEN